MSARGAEERGLAGQVALVTGGARRVGRRLVLDLAAAGAAVAIHHGQSTDEAAATAAEAREFGVPVTLLQGDLVDPEVPARLIVEATEALGPVTVLVNNASIFEPGSALDTDLDTWQRHQDINLRAPFLLSQAFACALPEDREGCIVNLNDWRALRPAADHFAYTSSKVGLHGLTRSLAVALAPRIRVNELALGAILPPERASEEYMHTLREEIPLRRFGSPEAVGAALVYLVRAGYVTGQTLLIDGGRHLV